MVDDRISALPDEIICHILSFLPTEDVFTTKLLSKRWRPLWLLLSNLDFDDRRCSRELYSQFINMVFISIYARSAHKPIKRFLLRCDGNSICEPKESDIVTWLTAAAERGMEHLDVHISSNQNFNCVFSFKNLVVLKLRAIHITTILPVDLPLLRTLHLNGVYFLEHWFLLEILNGCPILEDFEAKNIFVRNSANEYEAEFKRLTKLVKADISNLSVYNVPLEGFSNVEFLRLEEIYGCVPEFSNLTHLEFVSRRNVNWCLLYDVLEKCPKLQNLVLEMPQLVTSVSTLCWYPNIFPKCLLSQLKECTIANYRGHQYELKFVQHIMLNSKSLRRITICSPPSMNPREMLEMQKELSFFPMRSATCEVNFKFV
ncbi:F-box/FBD/LRR-repeat protein At5g56420-like [Vicia villosa]|uniref:F-box/FBD/LRR-repeat protein At5g56420-like n=1 Tax=Vicia villosa TaxID=3911 RepID=UPI00273A8C2A|nr:F-box/FBD/LRR-repeat protein At5g56420-like [Vicia villosa]